MADRKRRPTSRQLIAAYLSQCVRWCLRRFKYVRDLEDRNARHERLYRIMGGGLGPLSTGSPEDVRRYVSTCLAQRMPLGLAWDVTVCDLSPGVVGVEIDVERKVVERG